MIYYSYDKQTWRKGTTADAPSRPEVTSPDGFSFRGMINKNGGITMKRNIENVGRYMALKASFANAAILSRDCPACWLRHTHELLGMGMALRSMGFDVQYEWDDTGLIAAVTVNGLRFATEWPPDLMPL